MKSNVYINIYIMYILSHLGGAIRSIPRLFLLINYDTIKFLISEKLTNKSEDQQLHPETKEKLYALFRKLRDIFAQIWLKSQC